MADDHGITGAVDGKKSILMTMVAFSTIALYNVFELSIIIYVTFKQRKGLYFWSFIVATLGIIPHTVGFVLKFFGIPVVWWVPVTLVGIGWFCMVSGQSLVLYSRLHLVVRGREKTRWVLYMIIGNAIFIGIPLMVLAHLVNSPKTNPSTFRAFLKLDKAQVVIFATQELIISILYIYATIRLLDPVLHTEKSAARVLLNHLILVNVVVLILDATLLGTQFSGNFEIQTTYKSAVYSVKLKIEFSILNRLVDMVKDRSADFSSIPSSVAATQLARNVGTTSRSARTGI